MIKTRLMKLLRGSEKYIAIHIFWQWISLLFQIAAVSAAGSMLQKLYEQQMTVQTLGVTAGVVTAAVCLRFLGERQAAKASYRASADVKAVLRREIYEKLLRIGASYKERVPTSEVVQVSVEGVEQLEIYYGRYLPQLFYSLLAPITLFCVLSPISLKACIVLLVCVPLIPISIVAVQKFAKKLLSKYWGIYTELGDSFLENLQGLTTLKIYQADGQKAREMDEESERFRKITMRVLTMQLNSVSVMDLIAYGGAAIGMIVTVREFVSGAVSLAGAFTIILLASEFFIPLRLLGSFFHIAMNGMSASDKIFRILDLEEKSEADTKVQDLNQPQRGKKTGSGFSVSGSERTEIRMDHVRFAYEEGREVLRDVSLTVPSGSFVSLAGVSGCGKSTVASLLTGRNRSFSGEIRINGVPVQEIPEEVLMERITLVRHNSYLFKGTVRENLLMADAAATDRQMEDVLREVNLYDFLSVQNGLDTMLEEQGSNLSGGQRQRLAIARALLHDSPMYIFDEAASNIDVESEDRIMEVIRTLAKTKTVLFISHRLSNTVGSDCIYMMEGGRITESGTFGELMERGGAFASMYRAQQEMCGQYPAADNEEREVKRA